MTVPADPTAAQAPAGTPEPNLRFAVVVDADSVLVFRQVARSGSMTAAAQHLGWTQPAVSQHVKRLERELGTALLLRTGRSSRLSEAGRVLARHADGVAASLAAAEREVADLVGLRTGRVLLQAFPSAAATLVPAALARMTAEHPGLDVRSQEALPPQAERAVRDGSTDLALVFSYDEPAPSDLHLVPLLREPVCAVLPAAHPLGDCAEVALDELADQPWVAGCEVCRTHLVASAARAGFTPDVRHSTDDYLVAQGLVAAGLAVTLLPARALAAVRHPGVTTVPLRDQTFRVHVLLRPEAAAVPAVAALLQALVAGAPPARAAARSGRQV